MENQLSTEDVRAAMQRRLVNRLVATLAVVALMAQQMTPQCKGTIAGPTSELLIHNRDCIRYHKRTWGWKVYKRTRSWGIEVLRKRKLEGCA